MLEIHFCKAPISIVCDILALWGGGGGITASTPDIPLKWPLLNKATEGPFINDPHLSKCPSDLKKKSTQEKATFSGTIFYTLSPGVICFVASVSSKNHLLTGKHFLTAN